MPLLKDQHINTAGRLLVWEITEAQGELQTGVRLNDANQSRFKGMKSEMHRRAFLSVRHLMKVAGYTDADLFYDEFGKPNLRDGKHISITHSHHYAAIIISDQTVGIDMELARDKIIRIADKFALSEMQFLDATASDYISKLTVVWGVKESIFKIRNEAGISFNQHISVRPFELADAVAVGELHFDSANELFDIHFEIIEDFILVYAFYANNHQPNI